MMKLVQNVMEFMFHGWLIDGKFMNPSCEELGVFDVE